MYRLASIAAMATALLALAACSDDPAPGTTPALSSVPGTAPAGTQPSQRREIVAGLIADRDNARYTDEQLRAGPPDLPPPVPRVATAPRPPAPVPSAPPVGQVAMAPAAPVAPPAAVPGLPSDVVSDVFRRALAQSASVAVPAYIPPAPMAAPAVVPVAAPAAAPASMPTTAAGSSDVFAQVFQRALAQSTSGANAPTLGFAAPVPAAPVPAVAPAPMPTAAFTVGQPTALRFGENAKRLNNDHRAQIAATVEQWKNRRGSIRVVAQASDGAASRPSDQMLASFRIASERAEAVASELRRLGVPGQMIQVESRTGPLAGGQAARLVDIVLY